VLPATVTASVVSRAHAPEAGHPFASTRDALDRASLQAAPVEPDGRITAAATGVEDIVVRVDFGRVVAGLFAFDLDAPEGTVVDVALHERDGRPVDAFTPAVGTRYVARGVHDRYRALDPPGCARPRC
jgi:alpha-L-rhamnosidase